MIHAVFYSKFDTQEGRKVVHQVPDGAIVPTATAPQQPLLNFGDISFLVIPHQALCGNLLHVCSNGYRVLGCPICLTSPRYDRNQFIFNFCLVLAEEEEFSSFKSVVLKLVDLICGLEEQSGFLSRDRSASGTGKIHGLCEMLMEDLNNYCECMIPIDDVNTLNIKLFPTYPSPPPVRAWQVPLFTVRYEAFMDETWDLTMQKIVPHIDGVRCVRAIASLAGTDFGLTCRAIRHLVFYNCVLLLDIFSFSAIYAPTAQFSRTIATDEEMQRECAVYVNTRFAQPEPDERDLDGDEPIGSDSFAKAAPEPPSPSPSSSRSHNLHQLKDENDDDTNPYTDPDFEPSYLNPDLDASTTIWPRTASGRLVDGVTLVELYASLNQGKSVRRWREEHRDTLANVDVRRMLTFGIIKGFLYRVHKYAFSTGRKRGVGSVSGAGTLTPDGAVARALGLSGPAKGSSGGLSQGLGRQRQQQQQYQPHLQWYPYLPTTSRHNRTYGYNYNYNYGTAYASQEPEGKTEPASDSDDEDENGRNNKERSLVLDVADAGVDDATLAPYLDGLHCFDQICLELGMTDPELTARLERCPDEVCVIYR